MRANSKILIPTLALRCLEMFLYLPIHRRRSTTLQSSTMPTTSSSSTTKPQDQRRRHFRPTKKTRSCWEMMSKVKQFASHRSCLRLIIALDLSLISTENSLPFHFLRTFFLYPSTFHPTSSPEKLPKKSITIHLI